MKTRLLENLKLAVFHTALIAVLLGAIISTAHGDALILVREAAPGIRTGTPVRPLGTAAPLMIDEKGGLLLQCGDTRFTLTSYQPPVDRFKAAGYPGTPRQNPATNYGISLTASIAF